MTPKTLKSLTPEREEVPQSPPNNPHPDGRVPHQFQIDLGDLEDAQLRQLMEDLQWEVAHRELNVSLQGVHPWAAGGLCNRRWRLQCGWWGAHLPRREGMGTQRTATLTYWTPSTGGGDVKHLISTLATGLWLGTPQNKHFQWWCHAGKERSVLQTVVLWGTICHGPLPRIGGPGEHCQVIERGSSGRYGPVHGSYH